MQASELIKELKTTIEKHGDLDVRLMLYIFTGGIDLIRYGVNSVEISKSDDFI
ncbi:MAG: hypothetical protein KAI84_10765 [Gammaproteobacteria bacterium]|jgi:hypothetical protein|nr:hypothetical protein [Gammaproteobacteria bacterium]